MLTGAGHLVPALFVTFEVVRACCCPTCCQALVLGIRYPKRLTACVGPCVGP